MQTLHRMPFNVDLWGKVSARLTRAERGLLLDAAVASWNGTVLGEAPGTLPNDDEALRTILRGATDAELEVLRKHFRPNPDDPTQLLCAWLADAYAEAVKAHQSAVERGKLGGRPRRDPALPRTPKRHPARRQPIAPQADAAPKSSALAQLKQPKPNSSGGGVYDSSSSGAASGALAGPAGAASAEPPPTAEAGAGSTSERPAEGWIRAHPDARPAIERAVDQSIRQDYPGLDPDTARWAAVRARRLEGAIEQAYHASPQGQAEIARRRVLMGLVPSPSRTAVSPDRGSVSPPRLEVAHAC